MPPFLERITVFCFAASYAVALALEVWRLARPRPILRVVGLGFGAAGILAHSVYMLVQPLPLGSPYGSFLFLAWILAVFYFYGAVHHHGLAWGLFVLPLVLALIGLAVAAPATPREVEGTVWQSFQGERFWGLVHGVLVLLAAVGISVGFLASVMYLIQVYRLRAKLPPAQGVRMLSLERLETMNRRAVLLAFPLLTAGLIVGIAVQVKRGTFFEGWDSYKILSAFGLWIVFAILLYLRYGIHVRGRQVALLTIVAFALLLLALLSPEHHFLNGGGRS